MQLTGGSICKVPRASLLANGSNHPVCELQIGAYLLFPTLCFGDSGQELIYHMGKAVNVTM
jgi:hypothetical protein